MQIQGTYEQTVGRTTSFTHEVGFDYNIKAGISSGVSFLGSEGEVTFEASFTFSTSMSFSESIQQSTTRSFTFTLMAAPNKTNLGEAVVLESTGSVPYQLVFDFGGVEKTVQGTWTGIAAGTAEFQSREVEHIPCSR